MHAPTVVAPTYRAHAGDRQPRCVLVQCWIQGRLASWHPGPGRHPVLVNALRRDPPLAGEQQLKMAGSWAAGAAWLFQQACTCGGWCISSYVVIVMQSYPIVVQVAAS